MASALYPACFNAVNRLLPAVRAETARRLAREGLPQDRVAEHLGVSQAMVSKYIRRGAEPVLPATARLVSELVESSVHRALAEEERGAIAPWCPVCDAFNAKGMLSSKEPFAGLDECLRQEPASARGGNARVLENLQQAAERLRRANPAPLVPQVRINLAMCRPEAKNLRDVAAFPGRFVDVRGDVRPAAAPEFGASTHLAELLLKLRRTDPRMGAVVNLRWDDAIRAALRAAGLRARIFRRANGELVLGVPRGTRLDAAIDAGAFGIEPSLYLFGETAMDAVAKIELLLAHLRKETTA